MQITLLRHGKAVEREAWSGDDPERPLTREGVAQLRKALRAVAGVIDADEIWTSPWTRARQTAEIAAELWRLPLREVPWLAGEAEDPVEWGRLLRSAGDVVLVGHEPDLGRFIGYVLDGRMVALKKGGLAVLDGLPRPGQMELRLLLSPRVVLALAEG
jgi:phosphohistidine phosphatase